MLRLVISTSAVIPSAAVRAIASPKFRFITPIAADRRRFSTDAVARTQFLNAFDYEIKHYQMMKLRPAAPANLPFKFNHETRNVELHEQVTLTRELDGEKIQLTLCDLDRDISAAAIDSPARSVPVTVQISKSNGKSMKFAAIFSSDDIVIQRVTTKHGENDVIYSQLYINPESELQMALIELLKTKGIEKSMGGFFYDYMSWKSKLPYARLFSRSIEACSSGKCDENVEILNKMKKVVEEW